MFHWLTPSAKTFCFKLLRRREKEKERKRKMRVNCYQQSDTYICPFCFMSSPSPSSSPSPVFYTLGDGNRRLKTTWKTFQSNPSIPVAREMDQNFCTYWCKVFSVAPEKVNSEVISRKIRCLTSAETSNFSRITFRSQRCSDWWVPLGW